MKRKLDDSNVPSPSAGAEGTPNGGSATFATLGLDPRLLQAVAQEGFMTPTLVQAKAIPLALAGKDILARAKTGSGKTAAYLLPILHSLLQSKAAQTKTPKISALVLVPTRELAEQILKAVQSFTAFCAQDIRTVNLTHKVSESVQRSLLADLPDLVIATPARASSNITSGAFDLQNLSYLVIDEADLVLSYGYEDDLQLVSSSVPKGIQTFLMSATLTGEVSTLKGQFCRNPVILKLEEGEGPDEGVTQYVVKCGEDEKFLLAYVIFKLKLMKGKCIIFVGDIDRCYRLKLFLEQFGLRSCILNSELPVNSRIHIVDEFNKNVYDIIIATDEHDSFEEEDEPKETSAATNSKEPDDMEIDAKSDQHSKRASSKKQKSTKKDKEYGISRGIDFKNVACVLNFDLPTTSRAYTHRIGRTARAGNTGMALSFVIPKDQYRKHKPTSFPTAEHDEKVLARITKHQKQKGKEVKAYHFDMKQVDAFRYRMGDALRAVSGAAIREARARELRQELLKSEKLKRYFEENPDDLRHLRHDGELRAAKVQSHLKHVPDYLMPDQGKSAIGGDDVGFVGLNKAPDARLRKAKLNSRFRGRGRRAAGKGSDPLRTFKPKRK